MTVWAVVVFRLLSREAYSLYSARNSFFIRLSGCPWTIFLGNHILPASTRAKAFPPLRCLLAGR